MKFISTLHKSYDSYITLFEILKQLGINSETAPDNGFTTCILFNDEDEEEALSAIKEWLGEKLVYIVVSDNMYDDAQARRDYWKNNPTKTV